ncbi:hypothetical protein [Fibrobacter intestinalis]|uniref:hypothetical protein n=1 Tax=Fibrobacter intestinalis TaxID=28122 RepID=UPI00135666B6|nr:hypothetical protein [Fibrobacter intestinalis]
MTKNPQRGCEQMEKRLKIVSERLGNRKNAKTQWRRNPYRHPVIASSDSGP